MAENRRGKENRFYFSRGQMILLGAAFTFASLIIFILGVFVGKGIEGRKVLKKEEPLVKFSVKPGAVESSAAPTPQPNNELTFNDSLPRSAAASATPEEGPTAPKPIERGAKAETKEAAGGVRTATGVAKGAEKKSEKVAPAEATAKKADGADTAERKDHGKAWRAQVNAFPDEQSAKQIVDRLKNKGYNAYVTEFQNRGRNWFRVSVGKYNSRDEADKMVELLKTKENYPKTFAATR